MSERQGDYVYPASVCVWVCVSVCVSVTNILKNGPIVLSLSNFQEIIVILYLELIRFWESCDQMPLPKAEFKTVLICPYLNKKKQWR